MPFPAGYVELLEALAEAFTYYRQRTGVSPLLVGGAAAAIMTAGAFMSGDFDIIAEDDIAFAEALEQAGFVIDRRPGRLRGGFYHPDFPEYGVEQVSGPPFDGRSDRERLFVVRFHGEHSLTLPAFEDLIADRLGQHAVASASDPSRLLQAQAILSIAKEVDVHYLKQRVIEEGGDLNLLDLRPFS
jgi:hypothetical protein